MKGVFVQYGTCYCDQFHVLMQSLIELSRSVEVVLIGCTSYCRLHTSFRGGGGGGGEYELAVQFFPGCLSYHEPI